MKLHELKPNKVVRNPIIPESEVAARGLRWELVYTQNLGSQVLHRLRGIEGDFAGQELDLLGPFDEITPVAHELRPEKPNWLAYHQAFLLEQAFGMDALSAVQPGRLRIEPYQLVPVLRAIPLNENLPQPVIDLPIPPSALKEDAAPYRTRELFDFQTTTAPAGSGKLFTEQPVTRKRRKE